MVSSFGEKGRSEVIVAGKEHSEELLVVKEVHHAACLPDGMHSKLWRTNVNRLDARLRRHHRADRATAERVIPDDELLKGNASLLRYDLQYG